MKTARAFALAMLNGLLDDQTMLPFLDNLVATGYEGVCFHPRDGLLVPYASRHYWERLDVLIGASLERGLEVWHYDEFPYPSGAFGGAIPETLPATRVQTLEFHEVETKIAPNGLIDLGPGAFLGLLRGDEGGEWHDVSADCGPHFDTWVWGPWHNRFYTGTYHVHEELHERASADRYTTVYRPVSPLADGERLLAIKIRVVDGQKGGAGQPDITLPEVTDLFLESTYLPLSELSRRHGLQKTPVFQDEVTFHAAFPWNREIERQLRQDWDEGWKVRLAALHYGEGTQWEETRLSYRQICAGLLEKNWFERVAQFCQAHNLQMTGHLPGEESVVGHWNFLGDAFRSLHQFDVPGYDIISSTIADDLNRGQALGAKIVQSAAWLDGKTTMAEAFGANSFAADVEKNRSVLAWLALHNICRVFDHSTFSCTLSLRKYDAPPVNNRFNPLNEGRADVWAWHGWFCDLLEEFRFAPDTLILFPAESLSRFQLSEWEEWREAASLLESWFHTAFTHSLDAILIPSDRLDEVEVTDDGYSLRGQKFTNFWVPPVPSLHADTARALSRFANRKGFCRFEPSDGQSVFGGEVPLGGANRAVNEAELIEQGAAFFDGVAPSPLSGFSAARTLLKSRRRNQSGESILILQNPHDEALQVECSRYPGAVLKAPLGGLSSPLEETENGFRLVLKPREIVVFSDEAFSKPAKQSAEVRPQNARWRCDAANHLSLKKGALSLEGQSETSPFLPVPVSSVWPLDVPYNLNSHAIYAPPYSYTSFPVPLQLEGRFEIELETSLTELAMVIDEESLPFNCVVKWDGVALNGELRDLYDKGNQVFPIPPAALTPGPHLLSIEAPVTQAAQGILERPILVGDFVARDAQNAILRAAPRGWSAWQGQTWDEAGWPEGFGPFDYEFGFVVADSEVSDAANREWILELPPMIGVADVYVNGQSMGRLAWEPRHMALAGLVSGPNTIQVRVFGSWNNLFSALNRCPNGLRGEPVLRRLDRTDSKINHANFSNAQQLSATL